MDRCEQCGLRTKVDGWRFCRECFETRNKSTLAERARKAKEGRQRIKTGRDFNSVIDADHDEQIGGMSRSVRAMEEPA